MEEMILQYVPVLAGLWPPLQVLILAVAGWATTAVGILTILESFGAPMRLVAVATTKIKWDNRFVAEYIWWVDAAKDVALAVTVTKWRAARERFKRILEDYKLPVKERRWE